jgi:hypothetical protein
VVNQLNQLAFQGFERGFSFELDDVMAGIGTECNKNLLAGLKHRGWETGFKVVALAIQWVISTSFVGC